jgi:uncharacterized protein involved in exopolysaccharide biosynthesis
MNEDKGLTIRDILNIIYKRILILKLVVILVPLSVLLACLIVKPVYETDAKIIITAKKDAASLLEPSAAGSARVLNMNVDEIDQNSEMEILSSPDLWLKTVQALGPNFFKDEGTGAISKMISSFKEGLAGIFESGEKSKKEENSELMRDRAISLALIKKFKVTPVPKSKVLDLTLKDSNPLKVQQILSKLLDTYIPYHSKVYSVPGAQVFFSDQLEAAKERYEIARKNLTDHKKKWGLSVVERQETELITTLKSLEDAIIEADANVNQYKQSLALLKKGDMPTGGLAPSVQRGNESTVLNVLAVQLVQAGQKQLQVGEVFAAESRDFGAATDQYINVRSTFASALASESAILEIKKTSLEENKKRVMDQMKTLIVKGDDARALQLEFTIAREQYLQFVAKNQAALIESSEGRQKLVDIKLLGKPWIPKNPVSPKTGLYVILSFIFSFPLGIGIIFVAAFLDHTFDDPSRLEAATGYKVLASFEKMKDEKADKDDK